MNNVHRHISIQNVLRNVYIICIYFCFHIISLNRNWFSKLFRPPEQVITEASLINLHIIFDASWDFSSSLQLDLWELPSSWVSFLRDVHQTANTCFFLLSLHCTPCWNKYLKSKQIFFFRSSSLEFSICFPLASLWPLTPEREKGVFLVKRLTRKTREGRLPLFPTGIVLALSTREKGH